MADSTSPVTRAAGILLVAPTGRLLLLRRTDAGSLWAFPGGKIEEGETPEDAARRETAEETGIALPAGLTPWTRRIKDGVDFTTFFGSVAEEVAPTLSDEHDLCQWVTVDEALSLPGLHPGCRIALIKDQLDELGIARAMRMGELVSPQRYQNLLLIALRVTGTGASFRSKLNEYVWRDPKHYLTDEFLKRCQGLPVIWEHPPKQLDGAEFKERVVGTVMLPYIQGSEVWGIAKIYDEAAAIMLETEQLSTSPGVKVSGSKMPTEDGRHMLIEDNPTLLDHVAICEVGVWDKGGPPTGVANQSGEITMSDEIKKDEAAKPKATLDSIAAHLDSLHTKMDGMTERQDRLDSRMDSMSEEKKDSAKEEEKKDSDKEEEKKDADKEEEKKDAAEEEKKDADESVTDKKDSDKDEKKDDSTTNDSEEKSMPNRTDGDDIAKRVAALEAGAAPLSPEKQREFATIQSRADKAFQAFDSAAPRWLVGEDPLTYRKRLLREHLIHSPTWKDTDLDHINDAKALDVIESKVYADSVEAARRPSAGGVPRLVRHVDRDETGRQIVSYYGDAGVAWDPFKLATRRLIGFNKKFD